MSILREVPLTFCLMLRPSSGQNEEQIQKLMYFPIKFSILSVVLKGDNNINFPIIETNSYLPYHM